MSVEPTSIPAGAYLFTGTLRATWLESHPAQRERYRFRPYEFLEWVLGQALLEPVPSWNWHLADYGNAGEMRTEQN